MRQHVQRPFIQSFLIWAVHHAAVCAAGASAASDYEHSVSVAGRLRMIEQPASTFAGLTVIDSSRLTTLLVDDGQGGTKTIDAVKVVTLTSFTAPYLDAQPLQRFTVDTTGNFRANIWVTVDGDLESYYADKALPTEDNTTVTTHMLQALGISNDGDYQALSFYTEPHFLTRPSFAPDIASREPPAWTGETYTFSYLERVNASFQGFAPTTKIDQTYQRPFDAFAGPEAYADWLNTWSSVSYDLEGNRPFPFTGLGWTWNWNPDPDLNGFALSEFIVSGGAEIYFDSLQPPLALVIPEPGCLFLLLAGSVGLCLYPRPVSRPLPPPYNRGP